ncbi:bromodomain containing protein [Nitzschia inconspicua]|uniref:Bromodomain containing protein n=1 Tax=Nitzschia inconspicua TaxID=303405 RepID=A0A9K3KZ75_9STRA|nr:bromodomain containing protein [Nitzschia inconspicua]KAG7352134.1 bromodomain containing protein [Nitzschia inconspicua]
MAASNTDAQWNAMTKIVNDFFKRSDCVPFREPVDWKGLGLYDYPQIIKRPMDLGTIKKNLKAKKYSNVADVAHDVRLIWSNCMTYNANGSDFYELANVLNLKFEEKYKKLLTDFMIEDKPSDNVDTSGSVTMEEKKAFAKLLYKLSKEDVGKIIVDVDTRCPSALTKNMSETEAELNVDKIPVGIFRELMAFAVNASKTSTSTKKVSKKKQ